MFVTPTRHYVLQSVYSDTNSDQS